MNEMSQTSSPLAASLPNLAGDHYMQVLSRLHLTLRPKTYFEIGVNTGESLALARCNTIGVDPAYSISPTAMVNVCAKDALYLFRMTSDDFFDRHRPSDLFGRPIDFAFLDGMHRCEYLLRDFINTERCCKRNSIIALHDCLPAEPAIATRVPNELPYIGPDRQGWWAGDVWRTALLLRRYRPDLSLTVVDAAPTGLVLITNLDPASTALSDNYDRHVRTMLGWHLHEIGVVPYFEEMMVEPTAAYVRDEDLTRKFWL